MVLTHAWGTFTFHFNLQGFSKTQRNGHPTIYWSCSAPCGPPVMMMHPCKMNHPFTNCAAIINEEDVEAVGTTGSETKRDAELCLLTASGFYGRGKVENLGEIDEYPWRSGASALTLTAHTFLLIFVGVSSPLRFSRVFQFAAVTNPQMQGKAILHSKGKSGLWWTHTDPCN